MNKAAFLLGCFAFSVISALAAEPTSTKVSFFAIGDVLMHSPLYESCKNDVSKCSFDKFFSAWGSDISSADYAAVNQETVFVPRSSGYSSYPTFGSPEQVGLAEVAAGFDIVTHATNHTMDRGATGVDYTLKFWKGKPVTLLGIHSKTDKSDSVIKYSEKNGIKFAFLNFTYGLNGQPVPKKRKNIVDLLDSNDRWLDFVRKADSTAEVVVAFLHLGIEYTEQPSEDAQKAVANAIDAGADIVVCSHPHVIEPFGVLKTSAGKQALVFWSLGNYISNQKKLGTVLGGAAKFEVQKTIDEKGNATIEVTKASFEGTVTYLDTTGFSSVPLRDYTPEMHEKHLWKDKMENFTVDELNNLYSRIVSSYKETNLVPVGQGLPFTIVR